MKDHNVKALSVESRELTPIISQTLDSGGEFKLLVTGDSMFPFIRHMRDSVFLMHPSKRRLRRGEIVFIERETRQLVLHRVLRMKKDGFLMNGDAQVWVEFVSLSEVVAVVGRFERNGRVISCDHRFYRFLSGLWMLLRPFRGLLFKVIRILAVIYRKFVPSRHHM